MRIQGSISKILVLSAIYVIPAFAYSRVEQPILTCSVKLTKAVERNGQIVPQEESALVSSEASYKDFGLQIINLKSDNDKLMTTHVALNQKIIINKNFRISFDAAASVQKDNSSWRLDGSIYSTISSLNGRLEEVKSDGSIEVIGYQKIKETSTIKGGRYLPFTKLEFINVNVLSVLATNAERSHKNVYLRSQPFENTKIVLEQNLLNGAREILSHVNLDCYLSGKLIEN